MEDLEYHMARLLSVTNDIVGYVVIPTSQLTKDARENAARKVFLNCMGFKDVREYSKLYPGNLNKTSKQNQAHEHLKSGIIYKNKRPYKSFLDVLVNEFEHVDRLNWIRYNIKNYYDNRDGCVDIQIYPKMEDVKKIDGCKNMDENRLWFCEDWSG